MRRSPFHAFLSKISPHLLAGLLSPWVLAQSAQPLPAEGFPAAAPAPEASASAPGPGLQPSPSSPPPSVASLSAKISYSSCNVEGPFVALTFDDGPHAQNTPRLLEMLKQRGVKATFFVIGQNAAEYPEILKRIAAEGHELANHSYTHPVLASLGEAGLREQMDKTHQVVLKTTGVSMKVMRPPYGALAEPQRRWVHSNFGYRVILWDVDPLDWKIRDAGRVEHEILARARSGSIILTHDIHKSTVDAMPSTIDALLAKGFKFVTVSELLSMDRPGVPKAAAQAPKTSSASGAVSGGKLAKTASAPVKVAEPAKSSKGSGSASADSGGAGSSKTPVSPAELRRKWLETQNQR